MPDIQGLCVLLERHSAEPCVQVAEKFRPATASDDERTTLVKNGLVPLLSNCSFAVSCVEGFSSLSYVLSMFFADTWITF